MKVGIKDVNIGELRVNLLIIVSLVLNLLRFRLWHFSYNLFQSSGKTIIFPWLYFCISLKALKNWCFKKNRKMLFLCVFYFQLLCCLINNISLTYRLPPFTYRHIWDFSKQKKIRCFNIVSSILDGTTWWYSLSIMELDLMWSC